MESSYTPSSPFLAVTVVKPNFRSINHHHSYRFSEATLSLKFEARTLLIRIISIYLFRSKLNGKGSLRVRRLKVRAVLWIRRIGNENAFVFSWQVRGSRVTEREKGGKCILYTHVNEGEKSGLSWERYRTPTKELSKI